MQRAIAETGRRRDKQIQYNQIHNITPRGIVKQVTDVMDVGEVAGPGSRRKRFDRVADSSADYDGLSPTQLNSRLKRLEDDMYAHARNLEFEEAARLRDEIAGLKERYIGAGAVS